MVYNIYSVIYVKFKKFLSSSLEAKLKKVAILEPYEIQIPGNRHYSPKFIEKTVMCNNNRKFQTNMYQKTIINKVQLICPF